MNPHLKAQKILHELGQHPAIPEMVSPVLSLLHIDILEVCKRGYSGHAERGISVYYTPANYVKYREEFDKEFKEYTEEGLKREKPLVRVRIPYKQMFGEPWKKDHVEYQGDLSFSVFVGMDFKHYFEPKNWQHCSGSGGKGRTFEEMIANLGLKFFQAHGRCTDEDFLTAAERANHKKHRFFLQRPSKDGRGYFMDPNPKYKEVTPAEVNRRWVKWFLTTPYCKKNWKETMEGVVSGKIVM